MAWFALVNFGRCTQTSLLSPLIAHCSRPKNLFFCSSVKNQNLRSSVESASSACQWKFFTKPYFRINPAGKSKVPSWKIFISQLENYFFSVGKSNFRSRAKYDDFLGLFLNYFKRFLFILKPICGLTVKVKMFDIERWAMSGERWVMRSWDVACSVWRFLSLVNLAKRI